ncbi:hypothetical protein BU23DRAFT_81688 [Bimuria novae-zelandiae CBS 107.79]|uniref:Uncharacterized protein n=1 Tax=Bimuria novae-zelandiae CBS 107.79 TaxID=1447943 RepID=A0A6A5VPS2_9PLEO|nr:hypothetical protein BU23DRAFT_81688 [Bimuria novae-zelandiae CBS 107.79]
MYDHKEAQKTPEPGLHNSSPNRPPQLNRTVCGCCCGRGSSRGHGTDDDGGRDQEDTLTLIASDASENGGEVFPGGFIPHESDAFIHGVRPDSPGSTLAPSRTSSPISNYSDAAESMENEPGSGVHSIWSLDPQSVPCMSPGPGIGAWTEQDTTEVSAFDYYFLARPLRLTPQHQYCRGVVASHLVLDDERYRGF